MTEHSFTESIVEEAALAWLSGLGIPVEGSARVATGIPTPCRDRRDSTRITSESRHQSRHDVAIITSARRSHSSREAGQFQQKRQKYFTAVRAGLEQNYEPMQRIFSDVIERTLQIHGET